VDEFADKARSGWRSSRTLPGGIAGALGIVFVRAASNMSNGLPWSERMDEAASLAVGFGTVLALFPIVFVRLRAFVLRVLALFAVALLAGGAVRVACNLASSSADWNRGLDRVVELAVGVSVALAFVGLFLRRSRYGVPAHG
jgi:hypothetical protein